MSDLAKKLLIKPGYNIALVNAPQAGRPIAGAPHLSRCDQPFDPIADVIDRVGGRQMLPSHQAG